MDAKLHYKDVCYIEHCRICNLNEHLTKFMKMGDTKSSQDICSKNNMMETIDNRKYSANAIDSRHKLFADHTEFSSKPLLVIQNKIYMETIDNRNSANAIETLLNLIANHSEFSLKTLFDNKNCMETLDNRRKSTNDIENFDNLMADHADLASKLWDAIDNKNDMEIIDNRAKSHSLSHCRKPHRHRGFVAMSELKLEDLPPGYRHHRVKRFITSLSKSVVKIKVYTTSPKRNNYEKYSLNVQSNSEIVRQGTGWVGQVLKEDVPETIRCSNPQCRHVEGPHDVIGPFYVMTARHVVFDEIEARRTEIISTNDASADDLYSNWVAEGHGVAYTSDKDRDLVYIKCYSHDLNIFSPLVSITKAMIKATMSLVDGDIESKSSQDCVFLISHPHNRSKHISFGSVEDKEEVDVEFDATTGRKRRGMLRYTYQVPTCPGSSGAAVCIMGTDGANYYQFPHSFDREKGKGVNYGLVDWLQD